jgi:hypothetical protein
MAVTSVIGGRKMILFWVLEAPLLSSRIEEPLLFAKD